MAKINRSDKQGSVGPSTFQRSRYGLVERQRVQPLNPRTELQEANRNLMAGVSNRWGHLTDEERAGWETLAAKLAGHRTGHQIHNSVNVILLNAGQPMLQAAPPVPAFGPLSCAGLVADATPRLQLLQVHAAAGADAFIVEACRPVSPGRKSVQNLFRYLRVMPGPGEGAVDIDLTEAYAARFGGVKPGRRIFVRVAAMKNGFRDTPLQFSAVVPRNTE